MVLMTRMVHRCIELAQHEMKCCSYCVPDAQEMKREHLCVLVVRGFWWAAVKASRHVHDATGCSWSQSVQNAQNLHVIEALGCILSIGRGALAVSLGGVAERVGDDRQEQRGECRCAGRDGGRRPGRAPAAGAVLVHLLRRALCHSARQSLGRIMPWLGMRC